MQLLVDRHSICKKMSKNFETVSNLFKKMKLVWSIWFFSTLYLSYSTTKHFIKFFINYSVKINRELLYNMKDIVSIVHFKDFFSNFWLSFYENINYKNYRNSIGFEKFSL